MTKYAVSFVYPNDQRFVVIETEDKDLAFKTYNNTSASHANHPDYIADEISVEFCEVDQDGAIQELESK